MASALGLPILRSASLALNAATWSNAEGEPAQLGELQRQAGNAVQSHCTQAQNIEHICCWFTVQLLPKYAHCTTGSHAELKNNPAA